VDPSVFRTELARNDTAGGALGCNAELVRTLYDLLFRVDLGRHDLSGELDELEAKHRDAVYAELIFILSHLHFAPDEAKRHWQRIATHRSSMEQRTGGPVDLRVALVSYFLEVDPKLQNPKIIELRLFQQTEAAAYRDELTGLCNFRLFQEHLSREINRCARYSSPLSLVMIDVDDFKEYNDRNGHLAGNEALSTVAKLLTDTLRKVDIAARYGGEEFALVLPSTEKTGAYQVAERARALIAGHHFSDGRSPSDRRLTVSMGVATCPADATRAEDLLRSADRALYVAKARGKNQIYLHDENSRSYRRINAELDGECCVVTAEHHSLTTLNISERGILFRVGRYIALGSLVTVTLVLAELQKEIVASGRVVRLEEKPGGGFDAAIRILDIDTSDRFVLTQYIERLSRREPIGEAWTSA
jgi:diguanylate cyclase (GGDEF)-like protein